MFPEKKTIGITKRIPTVTSTVVMDNTPSFGIIFTMMATTAFPTAVTSPNMIPNENANVMFEARRAPIKAINPQNQI